LFVHLVQDPVTRRSKVTKTPRMVVGTASSQKPEWRGIGGPLVLGRGRLCSSFFKS
jgi:hypothetical protein